MVDVGALSEVGFKMVGKGQCHFQVLEQEEGFREWGLWERKLGNKGTGKPCDGP